MARRPTTKDTSAAALAPNGPDIEFLENLTKWRNEAQLILFGLLQLVATYPEKIKQTDKYREIFQLLVGSAFSLWRAVFLADKPIRPAPAIPDAIKFLDRVVSDNIIGYADEKTSRRWTAGFYVGNIQYRMFHLNKSYQDELQVDALKFFVEEWNPFVSPGLSNRKEFFEDAIDCLHKLTKRLHDLAGKARKK